MESRIRASISALRGQSAWSPMPEHLLFAQLNKDTSPTPVTSDGENKCDECGMKFKSEAMLTYHKVGFCVGPPTDETLLQEIQTEASFDELEESKDEPSTRSNPIQRSARTTTVPGSSISRINKQKPTKLEWCMCAHGAVAPSAVKVGYDDSGQTFTYVCVAQVGDEVIPGTVLPTRKHATVLCAGRETNVTDYSVLTDLGGYSTWRRCELAGAIPRDAVRGGYDSDKLQYFIARGKAPDGNWCCGQYIPHKQQCVFAWEGNEHKTKDFEILCKTSPKEYFSNTDIKINKPKQMTETALKEGKTLISDSIKQTKSTTDNDYSTNKQDTLADIKIDDLKHKDNSTVKPNRQDTGIVTLSNTDTPEIGKEVKTHTKHDMAASRKNTGILKEKSKITNPRELTKSGVSRENGVTRDKSKTISRRELTKPDAIKERNISREKSKSVSQRELITPRVSKEQVSKEKSRIANTRELSKSGVSRENDVSKEKSKIINRRELITPRTSKDVLTNNSRNNNQQELRKSQSETTNNDVDKGELNT